MATLSTDPLYRCPLDDSYFQSQRKCRQHLLRHRSREKFAYMYDVASPAVSRDEFVAQLVAKTTAPQRVELLMEEYDPATEVDVVEGEKSRATARLELLGMTETVTRIRFSISIDSPLMITQWQTEHPDYTALTNQPVTYQSRQSNPQTNNPYEPGHPLYGTSPDGD